MSEEQPAKPNRQNPFSEAFREFIPQGWAPYASELPPARPAAAWTPARRAAIGAQFPTDRLVIPAGGLKVRANDTDYPFRPDTAFAYYTGLGEDREPDAVLVLEPVDNGEVHPLPHALLQAPSPTHRRGVLRRRALRRDVGGPA